VNEIFFDDADDRDPRLTDEWGVMRDRVEEMHASTFCDDGGEASGGRTDSMPSPLLNVDDLLLLGLL